MLIKIVRSNDHPRNFTLFDNAEAVECFCPVHFNGNLDGDRELRKWLQRPEEYSSYYYNFLDGLPNQGAVLPETPDHPWTLLTKRQSYSVARIKFMRAGESYRIVFDGTAYVCTDEGRTLERIEAGGMFTEPDLPQPESVRPAA
jgi:hypothetical protein